FGSFYTKQSSFHSPGGREAEARLRTSVTNPSRSLCVASLDHLVRAAQRCATKPRSLEHGRRATPRSARSVLDRCFTDLCVEGAHALDPPQTLAGVPDRER